MNPVLNKTFLNASPQIGNRLNNRDQQALWAATGRAMMRHGPPASLGFVEHIFLFRLPVMRMLCKSNSGTLGMTNSMQMHSADERWAGEADGDVARFPDGLTQLALADISGPN